MVRNKRTDWLVRSKRTDWLVRSKKTDWLVRSKRTDWLVRIMYPGGAKCLTRGGLILGVKGQTG